jgi:hypothetical protein
LPFKKGEFKIKIACLSIPKTSRSPRQENPTRAIIYVDGKEYGNVKIDDHFSIYELSRKFELITWDSIHLLHVLIANNICLPKKIIDLRMLASSLGLCNRSYQYSEEYWGLFSSFHFESTFNKKLSLKNIVEQYKEIKQTTSDGLFENVKLLNYKITEFLIPLLFNAHIVKREKGCLAQHIFPIHEPLSQKNGRFMSYPNDLTYTQKEKRAIYVADFGFNFISFDIKQASVDISRYFFDFFGFPLPKDLYAILEERYGQPKSRIKNIISAYIFGASEQKVAKMIKTLNMIGNIKQAHLLSDIKSFINRDAVYFAIEKQIKEKGFVSTLNKRARFFHISEVLSAWSYIVHGTESDILINSLIEISQDYPELNIPIINGDEILVLTDDNDIEKEIKNVIEKNSVHFNLGVKTQRGNTWLEATE